MPSEPLPPRSEPPAAALAAHAARHPDRPFLFWPEGLDWRWASFAEAAEEVERLREGMEPRLVERAAPAAAIEVLQRIAGGEAAAGVTAGRSQQEVVVLAPPFVDPGARGLLAWAVLAGAAVVVEPSPAGLVATAAWARPTVFRGTAGEIAALAAEAAAAERAGFAGFWRRLRRWLGGEPPPPRPFGRLHAVVVAGQPAAAVDAAFWQARGTRVLADGEAAAALADGAAE